MNRKKYDVKENAIYIAKVVIMFLPMLLVPILRKDYLCGYTIIRKLFKNIEMDWASVIFIGIYLLYGIILYCIIIVIKRISVSISGKRSNKK